MAPCPPSIKKWRVDLNVRQRHQSRGKVISAPLKIKGIKHHRRWCILSNIEMSCRVHYISMNNVKLFPFARPVPSQRPSVKC